MELVCSRKNLLVIVCVLILSLASNGDLLNSTNRSHFRVKDIVQSETKKSAQHQGKPDIGENKYLSPSNDNSKDSVYSIVTIQSNDAIINYTDFNTTSISSISENASECKSSQSPAIMLTIYIVQGIILNIICWAGILTNIVNLVVLTRPNMKSSTNVFLIAISVSDSFILLIVSTFYTHFVAAPDTPTSEDCQVASMAFPWQFFYFTWYMFANIFLTLSNWLIMGVTIFRYIAVCFPMRASRLCTSRRAKIGVGISTILAIILNVPDFFTVKITNLLHKIQHTGDNNITEETTALADGYKMDYTSLYEDKLFNEIYYDLKMSLNVYIPWLVCFALTIKLVHTLRIRSKEIKRLSEAERMLSSMSNTQKRISIMLIVLNIWFLACQLPSSIYYIWSITAGRKYVENNSVGARILRTIFADTLLVLNYSVNFFLYSASNRQYRQTFTRLWMRGRAGSASSYYRTSGSMHELKTTTTDLTKHRNSVKFKNGFVKVKNGDF